MTVKKLSIEDIPDLPGYSTVAKICNKWQVHKGTVLYMIYNQAAFPEGSVFKIGKGEEDQRPLLLIKTEAADKVMGQRVARLAAVTPTYLGDVNEWNKRVKQWGKDNGWHETIRVSGPPTRQLEAAYLRAHPDDMRPEEAERSEADRAYAEALASWSQRVKNWGRVTGWVETRIRATGLPNAPLVRAYMEQHPDDARPTKTELARRAARIEDEADSAESD